MREKRKRNEGKRKGEEMRREERETWVKERGGEDWGGTPAASWLI